MAKYEKLKPPTSGEKIKVLKGGALDVPNNPIIPFIEGDGIGADIWAASVRVFDAAVEKAYGGKRKISWYEIYAGEKANQVYGKPVWLPQDTLTAISEYKVAIKGPLTTPVGGGIRSINVALRQELDLYACIRPVRYFPGVPSPVKAPEKINIVIFRENTEDVYAGIEFKKGSPEAKKLIDWLNKGLLKKMKKTIRADSGVGIKPMSAFGSKRLIKRALQYAIDNKLASVTMMHKGNIQKFTEGAFMEWGYELAKKEFAGTVVKEGEQAPSAADKTAGVILKDRIADSMFQQIILRPEDYQVVACPNLNGDYFSDAAAAQVGGLGMAPGANIGDKAAVFEATHGTAPKYTGLDKVNPGSVILSGEMMLRHMGWNEAADLVIQGIQGAFAAKQVTYDMARQMPGATEVKCSEFGTAIISHMRGAQRKVA